MEHDRGIHRKTADLSARSRSAAAVNVSSTQPHGWGVQPKSLESTPATKAELWEKYQQAKQTTQERANNRHPAPAQSKTLPIQAKLTIGEPGDKYEHEADQVASQVVEQLHAPAALAQSTQGESVQRKDRLEEELQAKPSISHLQRSPLSPEVQPEAMPEEEDIQAKSILQREGIDEEEELQMKSLADSIQRVEIDDEGEQLQMKSQVQCREAIGGGEASTDLESSINSARGGGVAIADNIREPMEQAFGADFSGVKVHTDGQSDQLNRSIQARAFTTGQDVFFRSGEYNPGSRGGQELLAHELTHVVQQSGGAVQRSPQPQEQLQQTGLIQRFVRNGVDPLVNYNLGGDKSLLYGLHPSRLVTQHRLGTQDRAMGAKQPLRTIDEYNASVGINGLMTVNQAALGLFTVREALKEANPVAKWRTYFPSAAAVAADPDLQAWVSILRDKRQEIGLYDFGERGSFLSSKRAGKELINSKDRFTKNLGAPSAGHADNIKPGDINRFLHLSSYDKAEKVYLAMKPPKQSALNKWVYTAFFRRTSKLGIDFAINQLNAGINFNTAASIDHNSNDPQTNRPRIKGLEQANLTIDQSKNRSITISELRHIKKGRKNGTIAPGNVNFYDEY